MSIQATYTLTLNLYEMNHEIKPVAYQRFGTIADIHPMTVFAGFLALQGFWGDGNDYIEYQLKSKDVKFIAENIIKLDPKHEPLAEALRNRYINNAELYAKVTIVQS